MNPIELVTTISPGVVREHSDRIIVEHSDGDTSTFWKRSGERSVPDQLAPVREFFERFDGADLFSSTFKIAYLEKDAIDAKSAVVPSVSQLEERATELRQFFPEPAVVFMVQAGEWLYGAGASGKIFEVDEECAELSGTYTSLEEIIQEWAEAVRSGA